MTDKKRVSDIAVLFVNLKGLDAKTGEGDFRTAEGMATGVLERIYAPIEKWSGAALVFREEVLAAAFGPCRSGENAVLNAASAASEMQKALAPLQKDGLNAFFFVKSFSVNPDLAAAGPGRLVDRIRGFREAFNAGKKFKDSSAVFADEATVESLPAKTRASAARTGSEKFLRIKGPLRPAASKPKPGIPGGLSRESALEAVLSARAMREEGVYSLLDVRFVKGPGKESEASKKAWDELASKLSEDLPRLAEKRGGETARKTKTQVTFAFKGHSPSSGPVLDAMRAMMEIGFEAAESARKQGVGLKTACSIATAKAAWGEIAGLSQKPVSEASTRLADLKQHAIPGYSVVDWVTAEFLGDGYALVPGPGRKHFYPGDAHVAAILRADAGDDSEEGLVGRHAETGLIRKAIAKVTGSPSGMVISIAGAEGTGKSRLAWQAVKLAREAGAAAYCGSCSPDRVNSPLLPVKQILCAMLDSNQFADSASETDRLGEWLMKRMPITADTVHKSFRALFNLHGRKNPVDDYLPRLKLGIITKSILTYLESEAKIAPLLLVFENLHLAVKDTLDLIGKIENLTRKNRIVVMKTTVPAVRIPLGPGEVRMNLKKLSSAEAIKLAKHLLGAKAIGQDLAALLQKQDGIPGRITDVAKSLSAASRIGEQKGKLDFIQKKDKAAQVNPDASAAAAIRKTPRNDARLLGAAALLGRTFPARMLGASVGDSKVLPRLEVLADAGILLRTGIRAREFAFRETRTAVAAGAWVDGAAARKIHQKAGEYILSAHEDRIEEHMDRVVLHLKQAGQTKQLGEWLTKAAIHAKGAAMNGLAEEYFSEAMDLHKEDNNYRAWLMFEFAGLLCQTGRNDKALELLKEALSSLGKTAVFQEFDDRFDQSDLEAEEAAPADGEPEPVTQGGADGDADGEEEDEDSGDNGAVV